MNNMGGHHSCCATRDNYKPNGMYVAPYLEYKWYNNMGKNQCSWVTTPPKMAAMCATQQDLNTGSTCVTGENNAVLQRSSGSGCTAENSNCTYLGGSVAIQVADDTTQFGQCDTVAAAVTYTKPNISDTDTLAARVAMQNLKSSHFPVVSHDESNLFNTLSHNLRPTNSDDTLDGYVYGACVSNRAPKNFTIPDYAAGGNDDPTNVYMPMANMLYDSTNCGPRVNAEEDWGITETTDILAVMDGAVKTKYMLVPVPDTSATIPVGTEPQDGVKFYPKAYMAPWMRDLEYCAHHPDSSTCQAALGCQWTSDNTCKNTFKHFSDGGSGTAAPTITLQKKYLPTGKSMFPAGNGLPFSFDPDRAVQKICMEKWQNPAAYGTPSNPCGDSTAEPYDIIKPAPPIVIDNKVVEHYCRRFNQACSGEKPCLQKSCPANRPCLNKGTGTCENMDASTNQCPPTTHVYAGGAGATCVTKDDSGACPAYTDQDQCPTAASAAGGGVCYSTRMDSMGAPAVQACMAVPSGSGSAASNPIPPFDVQAQCFGHTTEEACNAHANLGQQSQYRCSWERIETSNDACAQHTTRDACTGECAWGLCEKITMEGGAAVCRAAQDTHTVHNAATDPFVWTMYDNFRKAANTQMSCGTSCATAMQTVDLADDINTPWGEPDICIPSSQQTRPEIGATGLNGIPFCAHTVAPAGAAAPSGQ